MALFKKKSPNAKVAKAAVPAWHSNFRNFERLPDTKTVRTSFFINCGAITLTLVLMGFSVWRELGVRALAAEAAGYEQQIARDQPLSDKAVALYAKLQQEEKRLRELDTFLQGGPGGGKFVLSDFVLHLGQTLPVRITIRYLDCQVTGVTLRGAVSGKPETASGDLDSYIKQLRSDPKHLPLFDEIRAISQDIEPSSGLLVFDMTLKFKDGGTKPAKDKEPKK